MKIKSPLSHWQEVKPLCLAGANEFFCGIEPYNWKKKYKDFCINQRSGTANFTKLGDLEKAIKIARQYKANVHVAVNAFFYLEEQYKISKEIIRDVLNIGAKGIIFADPALLSIIDRPLLKNKDVIMGCDASIFNSDSVKFYKRLGATRIVLPRSMTTGEISAVVKADKSLEYEAFIIHDLCFFEDGFCAYCKEQSGSIRKEGRDKKKLCLLSASRLPMRGHNGGCRSKFLRQKFFLKNDQKTSIRKPFTFWPRKHIEGCGSCAIYDFKKMGIDALKILDRSLPAEEKVRATEFIRKCLNLLDNRKVCREDFLESCKRLFKESFKKNCDYYDCYYPSVYG